MPTDLLERPVRHPASPLARRLLHDAGLHPRDVTGHGPDGAVLAADARTAIAQHRTLASPLARRLLHDAGLHPRDVTGHGPDGAVLAADARTAITQHRTLASPLARRLLHDAGLNPRDVTGHGPDGAVLAADARTAITQQDRPALREDDDPRADRVSLHERDLARATRSRRGLEVAAQLTAVVEVDMSRTMQTLVARAPRVLTAHGVELTPLAVVARAACLTLPRHPVLNASIDVDAGTATYRRDVDLGMEVDTDRGTSIPAVPRAGDLDLVGLARHLGEATDRATQGAVPPDGDPATFTVVDGHGRGTLLETPLLPPGQVAVLSLGLVVRRPVVVGEGPDERVGLRWNASLCLTYDHQLVDGADAARFLQDLRWVLEHHDLGPELRLA